MDLTAGGLLVDDAAGIIDAEEAVNADAAQFRIDPDFRELRAEGLKLKPLGRCCRRTRSPDPACRPCGRVADSRKPRSRPGRRSPPSAIRRRKGRAGGGCRQAGNSPSIPADPAWPRRTGRGSCRCPCQDHGWRPRSRPGHRRSGGPARRRTSCAGYVALAMP